MDKQAPLDVTLRSLSLASDQLNTNSNALNSAIAEVQTALQKYNLGVQAYVELAREGDGRDPYHKVWALSYSKQNGKWGLYVISYIDEDSDATWNPQALLEAPREWRMAAVDNFPALIETLVAEVNKSAAEAAKKVTQAKQIAASLTRNGK